MEESAFHVDFMAKRMPIGSLNLCCSDFVHLLLYSADTQNPSVDRCEVTKVHTLCRYMMSWATVIQQAVTMKKNKHVVKGGHYTGTGQLYTKRLSLLQFVYVSVRGLELRNTFSVIIWDMIFNEDQYTLNVTEGVRDVAIFNLVDQLKITNVT